MDTSRRRFLSAGLSVPGNRPPWAVAEQLFIAGCTFCGECIEACQPRALEHDDTRQPFPWRALIGTDCLAQHGVECRICAESCEDRAIRFRPQLGGIAQPELDSTRCNGCGACVAACPVSCITTPLKEEAA